MLCQRTSQNPVASRAHSGRGNADNPSADVLCGIAAARSAGQAIFFARNLAGRLVDLTFAGRDYRSKKKIAPRSQTKFYIAISRPGPLVPDNVGYPPQGPVFDLRRIEAAPQAFEQRLKRAGCFLPPCSPLAEANPGCSAPHYPTDHHWREPDFSQTGQRFLTGEHSLHLTPQKQTTDFAFIAPNRCLT